MVEWLVTCEQKPLLTAHKVNLGDHARLVDGVRIVVGLVSHRVVQARLAVVPDLAIQGRYALAPPLSRQTQGRSEAALRDHDPRNADVVSTTVEVPVQSMPIVTRPPVAVMRRRPSRWAMRMLPTVCKARLSGSRRGRIEARLDTSSASANAHAAIQ